MNHAMDSEACMKNELKVERAGMCVEGFSCAVIMRILVRVYGRLLEYFSNQFARIADYPKGG